jgi:hypothetical protein
MFPEDYLIDPYREGYLSASATTKMGLIPPQ